MGAELEGVESALSGGKSRAEHSHSPRRGSSEHILSTSPSSTPLWKVKDSLSEVVEDHDVGIHVEKVVAVGGVFVGGPLLWFGAPVGEHVIAVFGLVVHTVEAGHLPQRGSTVNNDSR